MKYFKIDRWVYHVPDKVAKKLREDLNKATHNSISFGKTREQVAEEFYSKYKHKFVIDDETIIG